MHGRIAALIAGEGPITFDRYVDHALYDEVAGFYATTGRAGGRRGDFVTSVEIGPLFGAVVAGWLDSTWREAGRPDRFAVAEIGAGVGTLYRAIHRAEPECLGALEYMLVERSAAQRARHSELPGTYRSLAEVPDERLHAILANELLDNLPFGIAERVEDGWTEVCVDVEEDDEGGRLVWAVDAQPVPARAYLSELAPGARPGDRVPIADQASAWVRRALERATRVLVFDYTASTRELAERGMDGWLRTYAGHTRGVDPLERPGACDITCDVPVDQLPAPSDTSTQAEWLRANGLDERVEEARRVWAERAHIGDLPAMVARSAIGEAAALTDPEGLGAFTVLEWRRTAI